MPVTGASIGNCFAENRESVQWDRPLLLSAARSCIIKIESEPNKDPVFGVIGIEEVAGRMTPTVRAGGPATVGNDVEDFGVTPDHFHVMTRDDLLRRNADLINHTATLLTALGAANARC